MASGKRNYTVPSHQGPSPLSTGSVRRVQEKADPMEGRTTDWWQRTTARVRPLIESEVRGLQGVCPHCLQAYMQVIYAKENKESVFVSTDKSTESVFVKSASPPSADFSGHVRNSSVKQ